MISAEVFPGLKDPPPPKPKGAEKRLITVLAIELNMSEDKVLPYINQHTRKRSIVLYRQILHAIMKFGTKKTLAQIGLKYGGLDHATVLHSCRTMRNLYQTDREIRSLINKILFKSGMEHIAKHFKDNSPINRST